MRHVCASHGATGGAHIPELANCVHILHRFHRERLRVPMPAPRALLAFVQDYSNLREARASQTEVYGVMFSVTEVS